MSVYGSYGVSSLPSSGDQFSTLTVTSQTLEPERFRNREVGVKWDANAALSLTAAAYRLDRTNTAAPDPADASRTVQTGAQRSSGVEIGVTGNVNSVWQVAGGFAAQRATIVSATSSSKAGATVPAVPHRTVSLWNRFQIVRQLGAGVGVVHQGETYAAIDNTVRLPGFTRVDGALFVSLPRALRAQMNVENLFDRRYFASAHGNNNIMPGAPRTLRVSLSTAR
jgi:catecholate siderophore receptor